MADKKNETPKAEKKNKAPKTVKLNIDGKEIEGKPISERTIGTKKTKQVFVKLAGPGKVSQWFNKSDVVK